MIPILYEDNHLLVVEKPPNVPSQEDESGDPDMLTLLKDMIKQRDAKPGNVFLGLVHRLDRPAGGVMIFAKTSKAASRLSQEIQHRSCQKMYLTIAHGHFEKPSGRLVHHLLKDETTNTVHVVKPGTSGAKEAILDYDVVQEKDGLSLAYVSLLTGRSHQIRVQFATIGHPLYGDQRYGKDQTKPGQQLALWSTEMSIQHPVKKEKMTFRSEPPQTDPWNRFNPSSFQDSLPLQAL